jgi:hypothetical protein
MPHLPLSPFELAMKTRIVNTFTRTTCAQAMLPCVKLGTGPSTATGEF